MKNSIRRLSIVIAVVLCLSLLPITTLAAGDFDIQDGELVKYNGSGGAVVIPDEATSIGNGAFQRLTNLTSVTIPNSVTSIGEDAFEHCDNLTSVTMGNGVTYIGGFAFDSCIRLTSITIPDSVTIIDILAFRGSGLTSVTIGKGVRAIGEGAFWACYDLTSVIIPENVTSIADDAFHFNGDGKNEPLPKVTIYGKTGSYAETYASDHNIPFLPEGSTTPPPVVTDKPSSWAVDQVNAAIAANLVPPPLRSEYTKATTRAEFAELAVVLYENLKGEIPESTYSSHSFLDTTDRNVRKAAAIGVVTGVGDNRFAPNTPLTREQAATMLSRLANAIGKPLAAQAATFSDSAQVSSWAIEAVGQMQTTGIMGGVGENTFAPKSDYTREQSIMTILRLYNIVNS